MARSFGGTGRVRAGYRGSRRKLRRIRLRGNCPAEVWSLLVLVLLSLFVGLPWLMHNPPRHEHGVFGQADDRRR
jgi:hypothetical protein